MKVKKILVADDFSAAANLAVRRAVELAGRYKADLRLVHATPPLRLLEGLSSARRQWSEEVRTRAAAALKSRADRMITDRQIGVSTGLLTGRASVAISEAVADFQPDLLVIGARGEGRVPNTKSGLGGTASKLVRSSTVPLLLVRRAETEFRGKALAALDLTPASKNVVRWADSMAATGELTVLHVFETPYASRLRTYGVSHEAIDVYAGDQQADRERLMHTILTEANIGDRVDALVVRGDALRTISAKLREVDIDILIIGKHRRRKRDEAAPDGSICHTLANSARVDVLVVS